jgi:transcriptional regulator with XRE-family HTH domain
MFAERLRQLRKLAHITQQDLANAVHVDRTSIGKYEIGGATPSVDVLMQIAEYFSTTSDYLLGRTDVRERTQVAQDGRRNRIMNDDPEVWELRDQLRKRPEMKTLFDMSRKATKDDVLRAIKIIDALSSPDGSD